MGHRVAEPPSTTTVLSDMPTLVGADAVIKFAREELGVELTRSMIRRATEARRIKVFKLSARNAFSPQGVRQYVLSLAHDVVGDDR